MNEDTFLSALRDNPTDEVTWLALADWLEDDGQADRAELLRLTRRLGSMPPRRRGDLPARVNELLDAGVRPVVVELVNSLGMRFALVPPGRFLMGSPRGEEGRLPHETQHEVEITQPIWMGVFPVTQGQYKKVMGNNPSAFQGGKGTKDCPVEQVSWNSAVEFLETLSALPAEAEKGWLYRLPTEAEWERACRGFGAYRAYHFGDHMSYRLANFIGSGLGRTSRVGSYPPNAFGLYDMHGNVWEWCLDAFDEAFYRDSPRQDPCNENYQETANRVIRGGAYLGACYASSSVPAVACEATDNEQLYYGQCRSASREGWPDDFAFRDLGFRAALVVEK
jgi:uncharacterized protein (TIGR02996 family)